MSLPEPPEDIVRDEGLVPNVKVGSPVEVPAHVDVNFTGSEIWLAMLGLPTACTYRT